MPNGLFCACLCLRRRGLSHDVVRYLIEHHLPDEWVFVFGPSTPLQAKLLPGWKALAARLTQVTFRGSSKEFQVLTRIQNAPPLLQLLIRERWSLLIGVHMDAMKAFIKTPGYFHVRENTIRTRWMTEASMKKPLF